MARNSLNRRDFLASACAATLAGVCSKHSAYAAESKMRFGMVTYQWGKDWDLPTLLANLEKAKVFGVELRTTHAHGVEPSLNDQQRREVKKRFEDSPITLVGIGSNENFDSPDPETLKKSIEASKAFVILSRDVGGSGVKVKPNSFHVGVPHEKTIEQIGKSLNQLGTFAQDYGQQIRLEVHGECAELPTMKAIMDVADHPNVRICWNSNRQDLEGQGLEYNFNLVKDLFGSTAHVRELDTADYPFQKLLDLFKGIQYSGWILLEASSNTPEVRKDRVQALIRQRELFEKMAAG
ncbi:MAG TPA: TIM barrel protein [bacterium]|nr:TIM barrel protein [bacterium]HQL62311.1 TIM barrel protein [bacterium]